MGAKRLHFPHQKNAMEISQCYIVVSNCLRLPMLLSIGVPNVLCSRQLSVFKGRYENTVVCTE